MLSFNLPSTTSVSTFTLAGMSGLSMGTDARNIDAGDPRRGTFATGANGVNWTKPKPATVVSSAPKRTASPTLSYGKSIPTTGNVGLSWVGGTPTLSMPASVPKSSSSSRFSLGGSLSSIVSSLSMGTPVAPAAQVSTQSSAARSVPQSVVPVQRTGDDNVMTDLMAEAATAFGDLFQKASAKADSFGGGASGGGGASVRGVTGTDALIAGGAAVVLLALLWPKGSKSAPAPRARRTAPKRRTIGAKR